MTAPVFSDASGGDMRDAAAGVQLRSDRFRLEREADWLRLDQIVTHMEKGRRRKLSDADVLDCRRCIAPRCRACRLRAKTRSMPG